MVSFMRLRQRKKVDFPQPDGPINAVIALAAMLQIQVLERLKLAVIETEIPHFDLVRHIVPRLLLSLVTRHSSPVTRRPYSPLSPSVTQTAP